MGDLSLIGGRTIIFFMLFFILLAIMINQLGLMGYISGEIDLSTIPMPIYREQHNPLVFEDVLRGHNFHIDQKTRLVSFSIEAGTKDENVVLVAKVINADNGVSLTILADKLTPGVLKNYPVSFDLTPGNYRIVIELIKDGNQIIKKIEREVSIQ